MSEDLPRPVCCAHHPGARAAWRCEHCQAALCPDCVAGTQADWKTRLDSCVHCEGLVFPLLGPAPATSLWELLRWMWRVHLRLASLFAGLGLLVWAERSSHLDRLVYGSAGQAIAWALPLGAMIAVAYCVVLHDTARGPDLVEGDGSTGLVAHGLKPALPWIPVVAGLLLLPLVDARSAAPAPERWLWSAPVLALTVLLSLAWPVAGVSRFARLDLARLARIPRRDWALCLGLSVVLGLFIHWLFWSGVALDVRGLTFDGILLRIGMALFVLVAARVHGLFLHAVAPRIGYVLPDRYRAPVMPDAVPRGVLPPKQEPVKVRRAPIEL